MIDLSDGLALDAARVAKASGAAVDLSPELSDDELLGGEDHSLFATFPPEVALPGGFRAIGEVVTGTGLLVDGEPYVELGGWDPYGSGDGAAAWNGDVN